MFTAPTAQTVGDIAHTIMIKHPGLIAVMDFTMHIGEPLTLRVLRDFAINNPNRMLMPINMQVIDLNAPKTLLNGLNMLRDSLSALGRVWIFGVIESFRYLMEREAFDFYMYIQSTAAFMEETGQIPLSTQNKTLGNEISYYRVALNLTRQRLRNERQKTVRQTILASLLRASIESGIPPDDEFNEWLYEFETHMTDSSSTSSDIADYTLLAESYQAAGDYQKALDWQIKAAHILEAVDPDGKHPDLGTCYENLSKIYMDMGNMTLALTWQRKAIAIRQYLHPDGLHPDLAASYNNMSLICLSMGNLSEALSWQLKAKGIRESLFGDGMHPGLAISYNNLAAIYHAMGNLLEALDWQLKAKDVGESILADAMHLDLAMYYSNLAVIYQAMGDDATSLSYKQKSKTQTGNQFGKDELAETASGVNAPTEFRTFMRSSVAMSQVGPLLSKRAENLSEIPNNFYAQPLFGDNYDAFYFGTHEARTGDIRNNPIDALIDGCINSIKPLYSLIVGQRGCGKTTELLTFIKAMQEQNSLVIYVPAFDKLDLFSVAYIDLLVVIMAELVIAAKKEGLAIEANIKKELLGYWQKRSMPDRVRSGFDGDEKQIFTEGAVDLSKLADFFDLAVLAMKTETVTRQAIQRVIMSEINVFLNLLRGLSNEIGLRLIKKRRPQFPIFVIDDLEKLNYENARDIFYANVNSLTALPIHFVSTFPIAGTYAPDFARIQNSFNIVILPMIKLRNWEHEQGYALYYKGWEAIRHIVFHRAEPSLFDQAALDLIIEKTGGSLSDLFWIIIQAAHRANRRNALRIEIDDARGALNILQSELIRNVKSSQFALFNKIYAGEKRLTHDADDLIELLNSRAVIEYNGKRWVDLHPLLEEYLMQNGTLP